MIRNRQTAIALALGCALLLPLGAVAQETGAKFGSPQLMRCGDDTIGASRLYPSPTLHDMNGDGHLDVVVGDLFGKLTVALQVPSEEGMTFAAEIPVPAQGGKDLKFNNW